MARATVGEYVVTSKLGSGSFATVYKGYHKVTKVPVAIKALTLAKLNGKLLANLETEIAIMRQIDHPNVVKLYEIKKTEKHMYLMLEYCAGGDLQQYMRRQQHQQQQQQQQQQSRDQTQQTATTTALPETVARHFLRELAQGMKCLWTHNLIHRDLKPQNLLLAEDSPTSALKIADFGFARHLGQASLAETLCGSPLYMAPEILKFQKYDAKADLWSVGTILFEMVIGRPPYGGANHVQLLANIERQDLRFPADAVVSEGCRALLVGLLHRRPASRMGFDEFFQHPFVGLGNEPVAGVVGVGGAPSDRRVTTSIREEDEDGEVPVSGIGAVQLDATKVRAASESHVDGQNSGSGDPLVNATGSSALRSSRSGNLEVMKTAFGATSSGSNTGPYGSRSRLGRSRRAASSGAILGGSQNSPKLSPQMSPNVLPSPGPRINPFKELSESPPSSRPSPSTGDGSSGSIRASKTLISIVRQKTGSQAALDSSGEYVMVDSSSEKGGPNPPRIQSSETTCAVANSDDQVQESVGIPFRQEYAQQVIDVVNLRIQALAPIAEQLWKMSSVGSSQSLDGVTASGTNLASMYSLESSVSASSALVGISGSSAALSASTMEAKQYVFAAESLALYVKCLRMIQRALVYLRQDPAFSRKPLGSHSPSKTPVAWSETSRRVAMAFLVEQMNGFLDRAEQCKKRMAIYLASSQFVLDDLQATVASQEELLYSHAIRLGKEGAVKEVLGQCHAAYELYLQATLLLETLVSEFPMASSRSSSLQSDQLALNADDRLRVSMVMKALEERLKAVKVAVDETHQEKPSPPSAPRLPLTASPV